MLSNVPSIQNLDKNFSPSIKKIPPENVCCIIYTSGTAGTPKGVMLTHKSIQANIIAASELLDEGNSLNNARFLSLLPLSHSYEHTVGCTCRYLLVQMYGSAAIPKDLLKTCRKYNPPL